MKNVPNLVIDFGEDVRFARDHILSNELFCQSPRLSRLLRFLVDKALAGAVHDTTEHAIGVAVFNRDPGSYYTCEDPIVRVQVGRLRHKLKLYYAREGQADKVKICIPVGSYMPIFERPDAVDAPVRKLSQLAVLPFKCISLDGRGASFVQGLHEELMHRLYKTFGDVVVARSDVALLEKSVVGRSQRLEGSIQVEAGSIKAFMRLIEEPSCHVVFSDQFSLQGDLGILLQEHLAASVCNLLQDFVLSGAA